MDNQQKFNELSAAIFSQLYDSFPIGTQLNIRDYPTFETEENSNIFFATIKFYIDEKFKDSLAGRKRIFTLPTLNFNEMLNFKNRVDLSIYVNK